MAFGYEELDVEYEVFLTSRVNPLTGVFSPNYDVASWLWDSKRIEGDATTSYMTTIGGHSWNLEEGTVDSQWQSGSTSGLAYSGVSLLRNHGILSWVPEVETGEYYVYWTGPRKLYSDFSVQGIIDRTNNANGVNVYTLPDGALYDSVSVTLYRRSGNSYIQNYYDLQYVSEFTGQLSGGARLSTVSGMSVVWANIEPRVREFIIDNGVLYTNTDYYLDIGQLPSYASLTNADAKIVMEHKGKGSESGRDVYTNFFPIEASSVSVISISPSDVVTEWTEQADLYTSGPGDYHFSVDYDLGIITLSGYKAPDCFLSAAINDSVTEIPVFDTDIDQFPEKGILLIDTEEIFYDRRELNKFSGCTRGYNATTPAAHSIGAKVAHQRQGEGTSHDVYVAYTAVPRVECEVTQHKQRSCNRSSWLDINPARNTETTNVLQMVSADLALASLVLETDSEKLGGNLHGPVYYGVDVSRLTATALDHQANPMTDLNVTIEILDGGIGFVGENQQQLSAITNSIGQIYTQYYAPIADVEQIVSTVSTGGGNTTLGGLKIDAGVDLSDVWLFEILKHDTHYGSIGIHDTSLQANINVESLPFGQCSILCESVLLDEDYIGGTAIIVYDATGTRVTKEISFLETVSHNNTLVSRVYLNGTVLSDDMTVNFVRSDETQWVSSLKNGVRRILYQWDTGYDHPITETPGAYAPVHPTSATATSLTYNGILLATPDPESASTNLGGYAVIAPSVVRLRAKAKDPVSGKIVYSNIIRLTVQLPEQMVGVDSTGVLPIPHGFQFVTDEFNVGTALGGANFLTVNPAASGINQFAIKIS